MKLTERPAWPSARVLLEIDTSPCDFGVENPDDVIRRPLGTVTDNFALAISTSDARATVTFALSPTLGMRSSETVALMQLAGLWLCFAAGARVQLCSLLGAAGEAAPAFWAGIVRPMRTARPAPVRYRAALRRLISKRVMGEL